MSKGQTAPGPVFEIDYLARRVAIRLAHDEIRRIRRECDWRPMRRTPNCWLRGTVESGRVDAANKLREAKSLLRALGTRPGRSDRGLHRDMMENRKMLEVRP